MSISGKSFANLSTFLLSDRSAATVSTRTFDFCAIADFTAARVSAVRDTMITLQPSAARISAVARPMPFEPPVIKAVLPASFRSMKSTQVRKTPDYEGPKRLQQQACELPRGSLDHAANALAMSHFGAKAEVARRRLDIDRAARSEGFSGVDFKAHRITRCTARCRD